MFLFSFSSISFHCFFWNAIFFPFAAAAAASFLLIIDTWSVCYLFVHI